MFCYTSTISRQNKKPSLLPASTLLTRHGTPPISMPPLRNSHSFVTRECHTQYCAPQNSYQIICLVSPLLPLSLINYDSIISDYFIFWRMTYNLMPISLHMDFFSSTSPSFKVPINPFRPTSHAFPNVSYSYHSSLLLLNSQSLLMMPFH